MYTATGRVNGGIIRRKGGDVSLPPLSQNPPPPPPLTPPPTPPTCNQVHIITFKNSLRLVLLSMQEF